MHGPHAAAEQPMAPVDPQTPLPKAVQSVTTAAIEDPEGIDILDLLISLLRARRAITLWTSTFMVIGFGIAMLLKPVYTATAVIMPPQQEQSAATSLIGQLGSLGSLGSAAGLGLKNPADMYVGILQSRVIADHLIDRFHLETVYGKKFRVQARESLRKNSDFEAAKDELIYIKVKAHDPKLAAALANAYVEELHDTNSRLAISQAAQRRVFYDGQLAEERKVLALAEDDLKQTEEKSGIIQLSGQADMTIRNIATMRAEIASREVQLGVTRTFATDQNPDVTRLQQEISALKNQLAILENSEQNQVPGDVQVPAGRVPAAGLEYLRKLREVRYHESLFELLAKQREAASLDEAKSVPLIQVVDSAEVPERRSGPSRTLITLGFALLGFLLSATWGILVDVLTVMGENPRQAARLSALRNAMSFRKP
jgi:tyrosine-protein kinase Etk/Wzc